MRTLNPFLYHRGSLNTSDITNDQKIWFAKDVLAGYHTGAYWDQRYNFPKNTVRNWANIFKVHGTILSQGRPSRLSEKEIEILHNTVNNAEFDLPRKAFDDKADELARKRAIEDTKRPLPDNYSLPKTNRKELDKIMNLSNKNAERHTAARATAESDIRNLVSFAAANHYMISHVNSNLLINSDATQFQVGGELKKKTQVKVYRGRNTHQQPMKTLPSKDENLTAFFIKYYATISCGGYLADPIFIVADENMKTNEIDHYVVSGLGIGPDASNKGYIVFCKDRSLCNTFYDWVLKESILNFIHKIQEANELEDDHVTWYTLDRESKQLTPYSSAENIKFLQDNSIEVGKPPGSLTRITQPADAYAFFKSIKTVLRHLNNHAKNSRLHDKLSSIIIQHENKIGSKLKPKHKSMAIQGLLDIQFAINKAVTPAMIIQSFVETGMYNDETESYDLSVMIKKFNITLDPDMMLKIASAVPKLSKIIGDKGELTEGDITKAGIPEPTNKDHLVVSRRRYITLTNDSHIENERKKNTKTSKRKRENTPANVTALNEVAVPRDAVKRVRKKTKYADCYVNGCEFDD
jgi:hypothetical protein